MLFEGGGGAMGDPLVLVQKYFGPRIAEMIPTMVEQLKRLQYLQKELWTTSKMLEV